VVKLCVTSGIVFIAGSWLAGVYCAGQCHALWIDAENTLSTSDSVGGDCVRTTTSLNWAVLTLDRRRWWLDDVRRTFSLEGCVPGSFRLQTLNADLSENFIGLVR
jgi:hypothetical protein